MPIASPPLSMADDRSEDGLTALILGGSGLVGRHCVAQLLSEDRYRSIRAVGRRTLPIEDERLEQIVVDLDEMASVAESFAVDHVFCCLGTTIRKAGSPEAFRRVDVEYPITAASLAVDAGASQFLVVSALGADPDSRIFYNRMKGEMEVGVRRLPLQAIWVLRPALLIGDRDESRIGEQVAEVVLRPLSPLLVGPMRRYRPVSAHSVARAMVALAARDGTGGTIESHEIEPIAGRAS